MSSTSNPFEHHRLRHWFLNRLTTKYHGYSNETTWCHSSAKIQAPSMAIRGGEPQVTSSKRRHIRALQEWIQFFALLTILVRTKFISCQGVIMAYVGETMVIVSKGGISNLIWPDAMWHLRHPLATPSGVSGPLADGKWKVWVCWIRITTNLGIWPRGVYKFLVLTATFRTRAVESGVSILHQYVGEL